MRIISKLPTLLVLVFLISCATNNVTSKKYVNDSFDNYKTFAYLTDTSFNSDEYDKDLSQNENASLIAVLNYKMIEKGFSIDKENPDLLVMVATSDKIDSNEDTKSIYERSSAGSSSPNYSTSNSSSNKKFSSGSDTESNNNPFKTGSLTVKVYNRTSKALIWEGKAEGFKSHIADQTLTTRMLDEIFKKFPI